MAAAAAAAPWSLWVLCILLILPVLLNVPGKATAWEFTLYIVVLSAVVTYPLLLPVLAVAQRWAHRRADPVALTLIRTATWGTFAAVVAILGTLAGTFYAHERARPVLSQDERFANSYANAILHQDTAWMDRIMGEGAGVDHPLSLGQTPALMSAAFGDWSLVAFLLGRGADPDRTDDQGRSVRTLAAAPITAPKSPTEALALDRVRALLGKR